MNLASIAFLYIVFLCVTLWIHARWIVSVPAKVHYVLRRSYRRGTKRLIPLIPGKHVLLPFLHSLSKNYLNDSIVTLPVEHSEKFVDTGNLFAKTQDGITILISATYSYVITDTVTFCEQHESLDNENMDELVQKVIQDMLTSDIAKTTFASSRDVSRTPIDQELVKQRKHTSMCIEFKWHATSQICRLVSL